MKIKLIDQYITKQFLQTIVFGLVAFVLIFVIIDMMENLDDFIDESVNSSIIVQYYIVFIPEIIRLMLPVAILLAALFTVGKLEGTNELTAIKTTGVSLYRFMIPFIIVAFFISIFSIYFGGFLVPDANEHKVFIEQKYMKKGLVTTGSNIFFQDSENRIVTIAYYDVSTDEANRVSIQEFSNEDLTRMVKRYDANKMRFDSTAQSWQLLNGVKREFEDSTESIAYFNNEFLGSLNFKPDDVIMKQRKPEEMTLTELSEFAQILKTAGNDPTRILIEFHSRISFAFTSFVVVLFGLPFSVNKRRGGVAIQFGVSTLITFIYLVFLKIVEAFGKNGVLDPFLTAWFANFIFLAAAIYYITRANK
ncbi:MAG: LptF/LptG family permease [Melioribacteraceae bacterium]|nr:LptF/LptG family permease [Melioribacteraceae bacterium]